jgi:hypothetical protein
LQTERTWLGKFGRLGGMNLAWTIVALGAPVAPLHNDDRSEQAERADVGASARLRHEAADSAALAHSSGGLTLGIDVYASYEPADDVTVFGQVEAVIDLAGRYDDGEGAPEMRPVIADPGRVSVDQFFVEYRPPAASLRLGRQRILHGEQRFVGAADFRQTGQSFDALRAQFSAPLGGTIDLSYIAAIKRPLGPRGDDATTSGTGLLATAEVSTPIGTLAAFGYALDFSNAPGRPRMQGGRSTTYGIAIDGERGDSAFSVEWSASFAVQYDRPSRTAARYVKTQLGTRRSGGSVSVRYERLGGGAAPFSTPLGTNHAFQGFAGVFLTTPPDGVEDLSVNLGSPPVDALGLSRIAVRGSLHDFGAADTRQHYGREFDLALFASWRGYRLSIERAGYRSDGFGADLTRWWLTATRRF